MRDDKKTIVAFEPTDEQKKRITNFLVDIGILAKKYKITNDELCAVVMVISKGIGLHGGMIVKEREPLR